MILLYVFPWILGLFTQEPYGYLAGVGFLCTISILLTFPAAAAELMIDSKWRFAFLTGYYALLAWMFIP